MLRSCLIRHIETKCNINFFYFIYIMLRYLSKLVNKPILYTSIRINVLKSRQLVEIINDMINESESYFNVNDPDTITGRDYVLANGGGSSGIWINNYFSNNIIDGAIVSHTNAWDLKLSACKLFFNNTTYSFAAYDSNTSNMTICYNDGTWKYDPRATYSSYSPDWNNYGAGMATLTAGKYCFVDFFVGTTGIVYAVVGQAEYASDVLALAGTLTLPPLTMTKICRQTYAYADSNWVSLAYSMDQSLISLNTSKRVRIGAVSDLYSNTETFKVKGTSLTSFTIEDSITSYPLISMRAVGSQYEIMTLGCYLDNGGGFYRQSDSSGYGMIVSKIAGTYALTFTNSATVGQAVGTSFPVLSSSISSGTVLFYCPPIYATTVGITNRDVYVDDTGLVGYVSSLRNHKIIIPNTSFDWIYDLKGYGYYRKKKVNGVYLDEPDGNTVDYGLIAEETELVNEHICFYDDVNNKIAYDPITNAPIKGQNTPDWKLSGVQYSKLIVPLLVKVQEQKKEIDLLKTSVGNLNLIVANLNNALANLTTAFNNYVNSH